MEKINNEKFFQTLKKEVIEQNENHIESFNIEILKQKNKDYLNNIIKTLIMKNVNNYFYDFRKIMEFLKEYVEEYYKKDLKAEILTKEEDLLKKIYDFLSKISNKENVLKVKLENDSELFIAKELYEYINFLKEFYIKNLEVDLEKEEKKEEISNKFLSIIKKEILYLKQEVKENVNLIREIFSIFLVEDKNFFEKKIMDIKNLHNVLFDKIKFKILNSKYDVLKEIELLNKIREKLNFANLNLKGCILKCKKETIKINAILEYYKNIFNFEEIINDECLEERENIKILIAECFFKINFFYENWKDIAK